MSLNSNIVQQQENLGNTVVNTRKPSAPLSTLVAESLNEYFEKLNGTAPNDLYKLVISQVEQPLFERVMQHVGGNQTKAAELMGISRATLRKKLAIYDID